MISHDDIDWKDRNVPIDVVQHICEQMQYGDVLAARLVCRQWRRAAELCTEPWLHWLRKHGPKTAYDGEMRTIFQSHRLASHQVIAHALLEALQEYERDIIYHTNQYIRFVDKANKRFDRAAVAETHQTRAKETLEAFLAQCQN